MLMTGQDYNRLDAASALVEPDPLLRQGLDHPEALVERRLKLVHDDGSRRFYRAWRCVHSTLLGPAKGGTRYHDGVDAREVVTLAQKMSLKTALLDLPLGGGKGGIAVDPDALSVAERERLTRAYTRAFAADIGPDRDIPAPDMGNGEADMGWMRDEYEQVTGGSCPAVVTGKPTLLGGLQLREGATARGGYRVLEALKQPLSLNGEIRLAVQGFGKVGAQMACRLSNNGFKLVAVADSSATLICEDGVDAARLAQAKGAGQSLAQLCEAEGFQQAAREAVLTQDCDLLVPAALGGMIDAEMAEQVRARLILELANGAVLPEADHGLADRGICVLPDILASAGGVVASYHEWMAGKAGREVVVEAAANRLDQTMAEAAQAAWDMAEEKDCPLTIACYALAIERLDRAACLRAMNC
ncbi:MAG: Glu/Leu/Phe/Val dehydrogenase [Rhodothalassiaceae bacterium]